jgi:hypothetical protein
MSKLNIKLTQSQAEFFHATDPYLLFCAGYGSGKSYLMGLMAVMDAMHSASCIIGLYEPDYHLIRTVAVPNVEHWLSEMGITYKHNKNEHVIYTSSPGIGDFMFKSMDNPDILVGYETYRSHLDELDTLPEEKANQAWSRILGRNRQFPKDVAEENMVWSEQQERMEVINKMRAYSTPEGFKFCYRRWGAKDLPGHRIIKGKTLENPGLTAAYLEDMKAQYTEEQLRAYMFGEFVNMTSGTVYYAYNRKLHESNEKIKDGEPLYIGCDFNVNNMAATIYVKRNGGLEWHAVGELHGVRDTPDLIDIIRDRYQGHTIIMYPDSTGRSRKTTNASISDISLLRQAGFIIRAKSQNPRVKDRISATNKAFEERRLLINSRLCPMVAQCFEQQAYAKNGEPDKNGGHDHQNDASTYPIVYELPVRKPAFNLDFSFAF